MNFVLIRNLLSIIFLGISCWIYYISYINSELVYTYKKDLVVRKTTLGAKSGFSVRDLSFSTVYNAKDNSIYQTDIVVEKYVWSNWVSIHRLLFLDKKALKNASDEDKIYFRLYLNNKIFFLRTLSFGLSVNQRPSKLNLHIDIFRYSTKIALVVFIILLCILEWYEKKYIGTTVWDSNFVFGNIPDNLGGIIFVLLIFL